MYQRDWCFLQLFCLRVWQTSSTAGSAPCRSEAALFTRHRQSYHPQLLPAARQQNGMEDIKPKNQHMSSSPSMSPLIKTRKMLALLKYLPPFSKASALSAQKKQKLISRVNFPFVIVVTQLGKLLVFGTWKSNTHHVFIPFTTMTRFLLFTEMKTGGDISSFPADGAVILLALGCRPAATTINDQFVGFSLSVFPCRQNTRAEMEQHASFLPGQETE